MNPDSELPAIVHAVPGVCAEVVGDAVEHGEPEGAGGSGIVALRRGGGVDATMVAG